MIFTATEADRQQIQDITARAGVFSQEEIDSVPEMFNEYLRYGTEGSGYHFIVYRDGEQVLGFAIYGPWRVARAEVPAVPRDFSVLAGSSLRR